MKMCGCYLHEEAGFSATRPKLALFDPELTPGIVTDAF